MSAPDLLPPAVPSSSQEMFTIEPCGSAIVVTLLVRELTARTAEELHARLVALLPGGSARQFVIDFERVRFMDSECIGILVAFLKAVARQHGRIALANVTENVRFIFAVTRLDRVFTLCPDVPAALAAVEGEGETG